MTFVCRAFNAACESSFRSFPVPRIDVFRILHPTHGVGEALLCRIVNEFHCLGCPFGDFRYVIQKQIGFGGIDIRGRRRTASFLRYSMTVLTYAFRNGFAEFLSSLSPDCPLFQLDELESQLLWAGPAGQVHTGIQLFLLDALRHPTCLRAILDVAPPTFILNRFPDTRNPHCDPFQFFQSFCSLCVERWRVNALNSTDGRLRTNFAGRCDVANWFVTQVMFRGEEHWSDPTGTMRMIMEFVSSELSFGAPRVNEALSRNVATVPKKGYDDHLDSITIMQLSPEAEIPFERFLGLRVRTHGGPTVALVAQMLRHRNLTQVTRPLVRRFKSEIQAMPDRTEVEEMLRLLASDPRFG